MDPIETAALAHIHKIEERAKQQTALIQRLKSAGQSASQAEATLETLTKSLREMRAQLRPLLPTAMDEKRSKSNSHPQRPARKRQSERASLTAATGAQELSEMMEMNRLSVPAVSAGALRGGVDRDSVNDADVQGAKGPRLVSFDRTSACDVIEKLRRDIARIDSCAECALARDHTISAFWTAWHIHQWLWEVISRQPELKTALLSYRGIDNDQIEDSVAFGRALAQRFVPLKICRMIATSPNYVRVFIPSHDQGDAAAGVPDAQGDRTGFNYAADTPSGSVPMVLILGRPIAATRLLNEVDQYWVTMMVDCGIE